MNKEEPVTETKTTKEIIKEDMVLLKSESGINFLLIQVNQH